MPIASAILNRSSASRNDPLRPLAEAIGSITGAMSDQVATALHQVLEATTPQSRNARLRLIRHLVDIESQTIGIEIPEPLIANTDLISTAQAAVLLGFSRPYVAMLIDQNRLQGATVSAGGHRRVPRAAVLEWKAKHHVAARSTNLRAEGQKTGVYQSPEAEAMRRLKAISKSS